jgi:hypothetical protein
MKTRWRLPRPQAIAANDVLGEREGALARETELQADLAARHQAADRRIAEARQTRARHDAEAEKASIAARDGVERLASLSRDVEHAGKDPAGGDRPRRTCRGHAWPRPRPPGPRPKRRRPSNAAPAPMPKAARRR